MRNHRLVRRVTTTTEEFVVGDPFCLGDDAGSDNAVVGPGATCPRPLHDAKDAPASAVTPCPPCPCAEDGNDG
jgi:hypothetical protein